MVASHPSSCFRSNGGYSSLPSPVSIRMRLLPVPTMYVLVPVRVNGPARARRGHIRRRTGAMDRQPQPIPYPHHAPGFMPSTRATHEDRRSTAATSITPCVRVSSGWRRHWQYHLPGRPDANFEDVIVSVFTSVSASALDMLSARG